MNLVDINLLRYSTGHPNECADRSVIPVLASMLQDLSINIEIAGGNLVIVVNHL